MTCPECGETTPFPASLDTVHCQACYGLLLDEDREADA